MLFLLLLLVIFPRLNRQSSTRKNCILITIDTLRADRLGVYGSEVATPSMDSLAREGIRYERAFSQVPITLPSHATILTGTYPYYHGIRHNGKFRLMAGATTIAEILKHMGYHTAAFVGAFVLDSKYGLDQGFDVYDDEMTGELYPGLQVYMNRPGGVVTRKAVSWLREAKEPFFMWVHYFDPHNPYDPPSPFKEQYSDPYDGEVAYVDMEVGKFLNSISERGMAQRTLVVLTADHGESLGEHGELTHAIFLYSATMRVPLIMSLPGVIPPDVRDTTIVRLVDVMPTILSTLDMDIPSVCAGRSLLDSTGRGGGSSVEYAYSETWAPRLQYGWSELRSVRDAKYLYVRAPHPELYDLLDDPDENKNIYGEMPLQQALFETVLDSIEAVETSSEVSEQLAIEENDREILEGLGYVFESHKPGADGADPKDMIEVHRDILSAFNLVSGGQYKEALDLLEEIRNRDEEDPAVYRGIGLCFDGLGEDSLSIVSFRKAIELDPMEERNYYAASNALARTGKMMQAAAMLEPLVAVYPEDQIARLRLARAYSRSGQDQKAQREYITAIELDRNNYRAYLSFGRFLAVRGRYEEALEQLEMTLRINKQCSEAHSLMGASYAKLDRLEEAVQSFSTSLEIDSTSKVVWLDLGRVLQKLNRIKQARNAFERALSLDPLYEPTRRALEEVSGEGGED